MTEFDLIEHYLKPAAGIDGQDVILGIGDDAAILQPSPGQQWVMTMDTLNADVHFSADDSPAAIAHKALAVNLSDIAAMGAIPRWVCLSLSLPIVDPAWLQTFSETLLQRLGHYQVALIGGDTCRGPLSLTVHLTGVASNDKILRRDGAKVGDDIYVTGYLGGAAYAWAVKQAGIDLPPTDWQAVSQRLQYPEPRLQQGQQLAGFASAAIDISDGLSADLSHILTASGVGALLWANDLPIDPVLARHAKKSQQLKHVLSGGDDYELCFTLAPQYSHLLPPGCHRIGVIEAEHGLRLQYDNGKIVPYSRQGYQHFQD